MKSKDNFQNIEFHGKSMLPTLREADLLTIETSTCYEIGDLVLFKMNELWTVHRLINYAGKTVLKGDRALHIDDIAPEKAMGVITGLTRDNIVYKWGNEGQPLKKCMAFCSAKSTAHAPRFWRLFFLTVMVMISKIALLLSSRHKPSEPCQIVP